jgi:hypothetical protein
MAALSLAAMSQEAALPAPAPQPQTAPLSLPKWDVVSIKPADQCPTGSGMQVLEDGLHIVCLPAPALIQIAWGISEPSRILKFTPAMSAPTDLSQEAAPSLFTAIQEQLGLKLEPSKAPLDVLAVDALQKPGEN